MNCLRSGVKWVQLTLPLTALALPLSVHFFSVGYAHQFWYTPGPTFCYPVVQSGRRTTSHFLSLRTFFFTDQSQFTAAVLARQLFVAVHLSLAACRPSSKIHDTTGKTRRWSLERALFSWVRIVTGLLKASCLCSPVTQ